MKRGQNDDKLMQEDSGKSIWRIPVCMDGNTEDSIWRQDSLDFLLKNGFDHLLWKIQCLDYTQLGGIWKALLKKAIITHNGLLDVLHLLKADKRGEDLVSVHSTDDFRDYLNKSNTSVYDTRVLYNRKMPFLNDSLRDLTEAILPPKALEAGSSHDASYDAYVTGHLCCRFQTSFMSESKNVLLETKRCKTKTTRSDRTTSSLHPSPQNSPNEAPIRPNATRKRAPKPLNMSNSVLSLNPRTRLVLPQYPFPNGTSHYIQPQQHLTHYHGQNSVQSQTLPSYNPINAYNLSSYPLQSPNSHTQQFPFPSYKGEKDSKDS